MEDEEEEDRRGRSAVFMPVAVGGRDWYLVFFRHSRLALKLALAVVWTYNQYDELFLWHVHEVLLLESEGKSQCSTVFTFFDSIFPRHNDTGFNRPRKTIVRASALSGGVEQRFSIEEADGTLKTD